MKDVALMQSYHTREAPEPNGHYSQAVRVCGLVFVATQLPLIPGPVVEMAAGIEAQVRQVIANVAAILMSGGSTLDDLVSVNLYVADMSFWPIVDRLYAEALGNHRPARGVVASPVLHLGALVAMQAIAVAPSRTFRE